MKTNSELLALIGKLDTLAHGYHAGRSPSQNVDDVTRREKILAESRETLHASGIDIARQCGTANAGKPLMTQHSVSPEARCQSAFEHLQMCIATDRGNNLQWRFSRKTANAWKAYDKARTEWNDERLKVKK